MMLAACGDLGITIDYHLLALLWVATGVADRNSLSFMGTHFKIPRCPTTMLPQCLWEFQNGTWAGPPISVSQYVMEEGANIAMAVQRTPSNTWRESFVPPLEGIFSWRPSQGPTWLTSDIISEPMSPCRQLKTLSEAHDENTTTV